MTDRAKLYDGISHAAVGYFFLYFNINLGKINIFPEFVGWYLLLQTVRDLKEERRDLTLLRPLGILLVLWNGVDWGVSFLGTTLSGRFPAVELVVTLASLYFHFQLMTDLAAIAAKYQKPEEILDRRLLKWRTLQTLLLTALSLQSYPMEWLPEWWKYVTMALAVAGLIAGLSLMMALFALRKIFREGGEESEKKTET